MEYKKNVRKLIEMSEKKNEKIREKYEGLNTSCQENLPKDDVTYPIIED